MANNNTARISSMTGYGACERETAIGRLMVEVRTVNNRFLDVSVRNPREFNAIENAIRDLVKSRLARGKAELFIRWEPAPELTPKIEIDAGLFDAYAKQIQALQARVADKGPLPLERILDFPGVVSGASGAEIDEETLWQAVSETVSAALDKLVEERLREGAALVADLRIHLETIAEESRSVEKLKDEAVDRWRERLAQKIEDWRAKNNAAIDEGRLESELCFYADRSDVTEELVRLAAHLEKFGATLDSPQGPLGKDLDFLTQEILREINTLGSKSRDTAIANSVLSMKAATEKIREQVQNLE
jgi:uncharacterized protein (TIGR00255 family)